MTCTKNSFDNVSFDSEGKLIEKAGLFPNFQQIESFSKDLELFENSKSSLSELFQKFVSIAQIEGLYFIQKYDDFCEVRHLFKDHILGC